jgi:hypothetical protein
MVQGQPEQKKKKKKKKQKKNKWLVCGGAGLSSKLYREEQIRSWSRPARV